VGVRQNPLQGTCRLAALVAALSYQLAQVFTRTHLGSIPEFGDLPRTPVVSTICSIALVIVTFVGQEKRWRALRRRLLPAAAGPASPVLLHFL
jgi:hypothetical protein